MSACGKVSRVRLVPSRLQRFSPQRTGGSNPCPIIIAGEFSQTSKEGFGPPLEWGTYPASEASIRARAVVPSLWHLRYQPKRGRMGRHYVVD
jgi:hypothetical protein